MPTLIMRTPKKQESRPENKKAARQAAFDFPQCFLRFSRSTFRVLLAPPRLVQSHFLSLDFSRVAGHQARGAERRFQCCIILDQGSRDAVAHRASLAAFAAAIDDHHDVESSDAFRQLERLAYDP